MKLSIIICVYNEVYTIEKLYNEVLSENLINNFEKEIIIVDNNSSDGTKLILNKFIKNKNTKIIFKNKNQGKGNSIIEGIKIATGDYLIFQDAYLLQDQAQLN